MIKKWYFYASLIVIITFLSLGFKPFNLEAKPWFLTEKTDGSEYILPSQEKEDYPNLNIPYTGNHFIGFKEAVAFKESQGKYRKVNTLGYMGKYQFGSKTLRAIGVHDSKDFLKDPALQEKAFVALLSKNKWILRNEIEKYDGKIINGVKITESGILAAAHLGGAGSVKNFFKNRGNRRFRDAYGTSLISYLKAFGGYDLSYIEADSNATIHD
ncbi:MULTISPECIES: peptidoglycan-binding protein LysM [Flavobacterium]|uniref:Peptidoglycan-binding protein LysM n=2 Tax=Flavobacterium TaxID=237 RepID=A0A940X9N4_9FLAO|nr:MULTISPECIES: peptidoglycan-binding protein LysM [Flavobacterium]MBP4138292.1 peptidoglycan-binding protein LysM [Flavobacterium geliluteum]MDX6183250.1 peptidoglycan-binding protein LysM [Flavobacterium sp. Fl-33]MDX6186534.1 peptidoglycan-binding protein LysM [Flavobacterium sp. Fl-77]UFH38696.1 peptidoglycan-binding protein LysM [Flavobacterium sp. F-70]